MDPAQSKTVLKPKNLSNFMSAWTIIALILGSLFTLSAKASLQCNSLFTSQSENSSWIQNLNESERHSLQEQKNFQDSFVPKLLKTNERFGWWQLGDLLIPDRFFFRTVFVGNRISYVDRDLQPFYQIDKSGNIERFDTGASAKLAGKYSQQSKLVLIRYMSRDEFEIWNAARVFKMFPSRDNYEKLMNASIKLDRDSKVRFRSGEIIWNSATVKEIISAELNNIGKFFNRLFFMTEESHKTFANNRIPVKFEITSKPDISSWYFGVENGYVEVGMPSGESRLQLLENFKINQ